MYTSKKRRGFKMDSRGTPEEISNSLYDKLILFFVFP